MADQYNPGYRFFVPAVTIADNWKAGYGLELIRISREADALSAATGKFVEAYYPTEGEFRESRKLFLNHRSRPRYSTTLTVRHVLGLYSRRRK